MRLLVEDALAEFPYTNVTIRTPCGTVDDGIAREILTHKQQQQQQQQQQSSSSSSSSSSSRSNLCAVSIVRSGDALVEAVREVEPSIRVGKILIQRDESTVEKFPKLIYHKLPNIVTAATSGGNNSSSTTSSTTTTTTTGRTTPDYILLCDPMLATGGSAVLALDVLCKEPYNVDPKHIVFVNLVCCPEGLLFLSQHYPDVKIVTIKIDSHLNHDKYIVPGLGDFGDRFYDT
jgi:uracil phosphoribosyltransferase